MAFQELRRVPLCYPACPGVCEGARGEDWIPQVKAEQPSEEQKWPTPVTGRDAHLEDASRDLVLPGAKRPLDVPGSRTGRMCGAITQAIRGSRLCTFMKERFPYFPLLRVDFFFPQ